MHETLLGSRCSVNDISLVNGIQSGPIVKSVPEHSDWSNLDSLSVDLDHDLNLDEKTDVFPVSNATTCDAKCTPW